MKTLDDALNTPGVIEIDTYDIDDELVYLASSKPGVCIDGVVTARTLRRIADHIDPPASADLPPLRPMYTAPRDRTPILVRFKDKLAHIRPDLKNWEGRYCVVSHPGWAVDGFDVGWGIAAPVGYGGIPDEWLAGWMHLPMDAPSSVQEKQDNADCSKISNGLEVHDDNGRCRANRDGECSWSDCPQSRDGEPHKSGRHCPRDIGREGEDD